MSIFPILTVIKDAEKSLHLGAIHDRFAVRYFAFLIVFQDFPLLDCYFEMQANVSSHWKTNECEKV